MIPTIPKLNILNISYLLLIDTNVPMAQLSLMPDIPESPTCAESTCTRAFLPAAQSSASPSATTSLSPPEPVDLGGCGGAPTLELEPVQHTPDPLPVARLMFYVHLVLRALGFDVRTGAGLPHALVRLIDYRNHHLLSLPELHSLASRPARALASRGHNPRVRRVAARRRVV